MSGMSILSAYLLATLGKNPNPTADDIVKILAAIGVQPKHDEIQHVIEAMKSHTPEELILKGNALISGSITLATFNSSPSEVEESRKKRVGVDLLASYWLASLAGEGNANPETVMKLVNNVRGSPANAEEASLLNEKISGDIIGFVDDAKSDVAAYVKTLKPVVVTAPATSASSAPSHYEVDDMCEDDVADADFGLFD